MKKARQTQLVAVDNFEMRMQRRTGHFLFACFCLDFALILYDCRSPSPAQFLANSHVFLGIRKRANLARYEPQSGFERLSAKPSESLF